MSSKNEDKKKESRHYKGKKNSDIVNFPVLFRRNALSPSNNQEILSAPITSYRILFKALNDLSNDQFQGKRQGDQLTLFEDDFKTENNTFARFTFKVSDIDKNKDYTAISKGLEFLENYNKRWYKSVNSKGKTIKSYGGVITAPNISEGEVSFLMSSYWVEQVLDIPSYNVAYFETPWILKKGKQVLFYLWLLEIPETGTSIDFDNFQKTYQYNYKDPQSLVKNVLKSIKTRLDSSSNVSFNYSVKKNKINIVKYYTKDIDLELSDVTLKKQEITQKLHYWKVRHNLEKNDIDVLKSLVNIDPLNFKIFLNAYDSFIKQCKSNNQKSTEFSKGDFMKMFQQHIIEIYTNSIWNDIDEKGYPIIS